jgi:hypothetical protein
LENNLIVNKLKPAVKEKFLDALRSGEYQQGHGQLCNNRRDTLRHCCLGVLTDLAVKEGVVQWTERNASGDLGIMAASGEFNSGILPDAVGVWAFESYERNGEGYEGDVPFANAYDSTLMTLNDRDRRSFIHIADIVEEYL